jgi:DNA-binding NarL/FixJ family response regulator
VETTRVVLADDHPMIRAGIRSLLRKAPDIEIVGEARNGAEAMRLVEELQPDVLLLDMEMPVLKGIEVARRLRAAGSPVRILALSAHSDRQYILGMLASGASGYLTKEEGLEKIVEAIRRVAKGGEEWARAGQAERAQVLKEKRPLGRVELTAREIEILSLLVAGKTNQAISVELGISKKTVEKHLSAIFAKLRVSSRVEAAEYALKAGLA